MMPPAITPPSVVKSRNVRHVVHLSKAIQTFGPDNCSEGVLLSFFFKFEALTFTALSLFLFLKLQLLNCKKILTVVAPRTSRRKNHITIIIRCVD